MLNRDILIAACRKNHLKVTPQRIAIYNLLAETHTHPTVEQVFMEVKREITSISLDTVYRILSSFAKIGLIKRLNHGCAVRYDGDMSPHYHYCCENCNKVFDINLPDLKISTSSIEKLGTIDNMELSFSGLCLDCKTNLQEPKTLKGDL